MSLSNLTQSPFQAPLYVDLWLRLLDSGDHGDPTARIFLLILLQTAFDVNGVNRRAAQTELGRRNTRTGKKLSLAASWFEVTRRLASNLFHLGRLGTINEQNRRLLEKCIAIFDYLMMQDTAASNPRVRKVYTGMRGVARLLVTRSFGGQTDGYELARKDLEESGVLGNRGIEHDHYLIECCIHLFDGIRDENLLNRAEEVLNENKYNLPKSRLLAFDAGEVHLHRGFRSAEAVDLERALASFEAAAGYFDLADFAPPDARLPDDYLHMKSGHARLRVYTTRHALAMPDDHSILNQAIEDLLTPA